MQVQSRICRSLDELVSYLDSLFSKLDDGSLMNWDYWRQNTVAVSQHYSEYWRETVYRLYSRDGVVLVVKVYDSGELAWIVESTHTCSCGDCNCGG